MRRAAHWGWAWLATLIALCALTALASAQTPPVVTHMVMAPQVARFLDSLANDAREHRVENGACVTAYAVRDSVLTLEQLGPAHYLVADSVTISTDSTSKGPGICPQGVPTIHSHVAWGGKTPPSETDRATARYRGMWNLLLSVRENGYLLFLY